VVGDPFHKADEGIMMGSRLRRIASIAGLVLAGGMLLAGPGTSCTSFLAQSAVSGLDASFVFRCQDAGGGTFVFQDIFTDCADSQQP